MSKKPDTKKTLAEASITLPEGAVVSVIKYGNFTEVHATRNDKELRMRVDNVSAQMVGTYLQMFVREIGRRRALITVKPTWVYQSVKPKNLDEFVKHMAVQDMFIFDVLAPELGPIHKVSDKPKNIDEHLADEKPKRRSKKKTKEKLAPISVEEVKTIFPNAQLLKN